MRKSEVLLIILNTICATFFVMTESYFFAAISCAAVAAGFFSVMYDKVK